MIALTLVLGILIVYPYLLYPLVLALLPKRGFSRLPWQAPSLPSVSILLSLYNEQDIISKKIENIFALDYPPDRLNVIVVSDGSTDNTESVVRPYDAKRITLIVQSREGKTAALNKAAAASNADILLFTDANTFFQPDAVQRLVTPFIDPRVGLVSGRVLPQGIETGEGLFGRFESFLKMHESRLGLIAGADGAMYALRRSLYQPLPAHIINDFYHPQAVTLAGFRSHFAPDALAFESSNEDIGREMARQQRMVNQALAVTRSMLPQLLVHGHLAAAWVLVSHKLLRWLHIPFFMFLLLCSFWALLKGGGSVNFLLVSAYLVLFLCASLVVKLRSLPFFLDMLYRFQTIHIAYFRGVLDFLRGRNIIVWNPRGGNISSV